MTSLHNTSRHTCRHCEIEVISFETATPTGSSPVGGWSDSPDDEPVYPTWRLPLKHGADGVREAARSGCPFFGVLWENLQAYGTDLSLDDMEEVLAAHKLSFEFQARKLRQTPIVDSKSPNDKSLLPTYDSTSQELYDVIGGTFIFDDDDSRRHEFSAVSDWDDPSATHAIARLVEGHTSSNQAIGQVRRWLQYCLAHHDKCKAAYSGIRPRRFLSVGDSNDSTTKVIQAQNLDNRDAEPYAALSYCWGHDQVFKTTSVNKAEVEDGIPLNLLPKTITDALQITRQLGIKLLWVDSLCLVQDDEAELAEEVAKMHHYYGNAHITISAATAKSCSEGFLQDQPIPRDEDYSSSEGPFYLPVDLGAKAKPSYLKFVRGTNEAHAVDSRAWTLQEGLLSQRLVSFGSRFVRWSCRTDSFGIERGVKRFQRRLLGADSGIGQIPKRFSLKKLLVWWEIVEDYSLRSMSNEKDKLPAISGVASALSTSSTDVSGQEYQSGFMAGLLVHYSLAHPPTMATHSAPEIKYHPKDHFQSWLLAIQLLWEPATWARSNWIDPDRWGPEVWDTFPAWNTQYSSYIAPSWSWASHMGQVQKLADPYIREIVRRIGEQRLGEEVSDLLSTKAWEQGLRIQEVCITPTSSEAPLGALTGASLTLEGHIFRPDEEQDRIERIDFDDWPEAIPPGDWKDLYCLKIIPDHKQDLLNDPKFPPEHGVRGIVLKSVELGDRFHGDEKVYRRVGLYRTKDPSLYDSTGELSGTVETIKII